MAGPGSAFDFDCPEGRVSAWALSTGFAQAKAVPRAAISQGPIPRPYAVRRPCRVLSRQGGISALALDERPSKPGAGALDTGEIGDVERGRPDRGSGIEALVGSRPPARGLWRLTLSRLLGRPSGAALQVHQALRGLDAR